MNDFTLPDGSTRRLGNIIPTSSHRVKWDVLGADENVAKLIPRAEWDSILKQYDSLDDFDPAVNKCPVHDQDGIGQCNPEAATLGEEVARVRQGLPYVQLSPADLYARINGNRDQGSLLEDAMEELKLRGVGTAATSGLLWKSGSFKKQAPAEERQRFITTELLLCPTFDHCFSAVLQGWGFVNGILWYDNFNTGADGWLPNAGRGRAGGHAIYGYKPTKATQHGETYGIWHQNSWGTSWGFNGRMVIPMSLMNGAIGGWWAIRQVKDEGVPNV